ncbi:hypothetical protein CEXT_582991 [Caerostris extrusa]|uniref:Uncharacterized protein n=1 Tax=Caerostris extrusa TaxID=172846 RepID=A0AAV4TJD9_CAEEX|nr:hypothetical protein CEXT_582991 [Caerostris extrusa]
MKRKRYPRTARRKHLQRNPSDYRNYWRGGEELFETTDLNVESPGRHLDSHGQPEEGFVGDRGVGGGPGMEIITQVPDGSAVLGQKFQRPFG